MVHSAERSPQIHSVTAVLTYLADTGEMPVAYPSAGGSEVTRWSGHYENREVTIRDGRGRPGGFNLDREGFMLAEHETTVTDFYDDRQVEEVYGPEIERLMQLVTGASRVVVFDTTRRSDSSATREERGIREPARNVHNDYTDRSAPRRVRDLLPPEEAETLLQRRFAIINAWQPIRGPVRTAGLALCDARSISPEDLIASERRAKDRVGEIQQVLYNPVHRWVHFPDMETREVLLIKTFDSATDGRARLSIHTAFDNPDAPADAPPRESIETRCFVFF